METIKITANAKLNLTLDITGKRGDGYHELETVMQSVTLADEVSITLTGTGETTVWCDNPDCPAGSGNLAFRAALGFFSACGAENPGLGIKIKKRIPMAAGLAGGSADAAAVLVGLDALLGTRLDGRTLEAIALRLGADVPFCMQGGTMLARGIGERLTPLKPLPDCSIVLAKPRESVSTAAAYAAFDLMGAASKPQTGRVLGSIENGDLKGIAGGLCNVLEEAAGLPAVGMIKAGMLDCGALGASMSGSGSAVFGLFDSAARAEECFAGLKMTFPEVFLCRTADFGCAITR